MLKGIIIGILIYSFILTLILLYENTSGYFTIESLDVIAAGPFAWLLVGIFAIIRFCIKKANIKFKNKEKQYKPKSRKYIEKIVKKIVKNYLSMSYHYDYVDFGRQRVIDSFDGTVGYSEILKNNWTKEKTNDKFLSLMYLQKEDTIEALKKYFIPVTEEMMKEDECSEYYINEHRKDKLYKIKE